MINTNNRTLSLPSGSSSSPDASDQLLIPCLNIAENGGGDGMEMMMMMSVLERQSAILKLQLQAQQQQHQQHHSLQHLMHFQQQQQQQQHSQVQEGSVFSDFNLHPPPSLVGPQGQGSVLTDLLARPIKPDLSLDYLSSWADLRGFVAEGVATDAMASFKKRKPAGDNDSTIHPPKGGEAEDGNNSVKKRKGRCAGAAEETGQHNTELPADCNNRNTNGSSQTKGNSGVNRDNKTNPEASSACTSKENNSKASEAQKPDYIHVRARRGQATDSHSLAERVRREKISERMKYLQDLVPGCNKITGKAGMLDEIINYVQSLQRQVEFLSMKLAAVNPKLDFNIDDFFAKEGFAYCASNYLMMGTSTEMGNYSQGYNIQCYNPTQQTGQDCGFEMGMNDVVDMGLRRTISAPVTLPAETFLDSSSSLAQQMQSCLPWNSADIQNLYSVEFEPSRSQSFPSQTFTGGTEAAGSLKMEI